jgi:integral membrane protein
VSDAVTGLGPVPRVVNLFRIAAVLESISWTGLIVSMVFKYTDHGEGGVHAFGPIHGGLFVLYLLLSVPATRAGRLDGRATLLTMAAAIPPFTSLLAEYRLRQRFDR